MAKLPVGLHFYTLREEAERDFLGTLKRVRDIGYTGVEFGGFGGLPADELRAFLAELGLQVVGSHTPLEELERDFANIVDYNVVLGNPRLTVPWIPEERRRNSMAWKKVALDLDALGARLREEGIALSYHNHAFELELRDGTHAMNILMEGSKPENLSFELDAYWVKRADLCPVDCLKHLGARCTLVHLNDMNGDDLRSFTEAGAGAMDVDSIIKAAETGGHVEWLVVENDHCTVPPLESVRVSFENLRAHKHA